MLKRFTWVAQVCLNHNLICICLCPRRNQIVSLGAWRSLMGFILWNKYPAAAFIAFLKVKELDDTTILRIWQTVIYNKLLYTQTNYYIYNNDAHNLTNRLFSSHVFINKKFPTIVFTALNIFAPSSTVLIHRSS